MAEMVRIEVNRRRYVVALVLTIIVFSLGLLIGYGITGIRLQYTADVEKQQRLAYDSLQVQTLYISNLLERGDCNALAKTLEKNIDDVERTAQKLEDFIKDTKSKEDYSVLKRQYVISQIRYWLLAQEANKICKKDSVAVLYFYSVNEEGCGDCTTQGVILSYLKEVLKEKLLVFSLDANFNEEPLIGLITGNYNVKKTPALIMNDKLYEGLISKESLFVGRVQTPTLAMVVERDFKILENAKNSNNR